MKEWVKMPSKQFMDTQLTPLTKMRWKASGGNADMIAALMIYIALVHHANESDSRTHGPVGSVKITYDVLCQVIGISRNKLSGGLQNVTRIYRLDHWMLTTRCTFTKPQVSAIIQLIDRQE